MSSTNPVRPPDLKLPNKEPSFFEKHTKALAGGAVAVVAVASLAAGLSHHNSSPKAVPTPTPSVSVGQANAPSVAPTSQAANTAPVKTSTATSTDTSDSDDGDNSAVQIAANNFIKNIKSGKSGQAWANAMSSMTTSAFDTSLIHASPDSIPNGAVSTDFQDGNVDNVWVATAYDKGGNQLYTFDIGGFKDKQGHGVLQVMSMNIPTTTGTHYDSKGYPIPAPIQPLSTNGEQSLNDLAAAALRTYFEYDGVPNVNDRTKAVKAAVNGGYFPPFRPDNNLGDAAHVQMYAPSDVHMLNAASGEPVKAGAISVAMTCSYANTNQTEVAPVEAPIKEAVDFKWDNNLGSWTPMGIRQL